MTVPTTGPLTPTGGPMRVVVVDDTADLRDLMRMALERSGDFVVVGEAANGREGVEVVSSQQPDIVFLDIAMPVMDGLEALPRVRAACPTATIVMLSGFGASEMTGRALEGGADGYIQKGQPLSALLAQVRTLVARTVAKRAGHAEPPTDGPPDEPSQVITSVRRSGEDHVLYLQAQVGDEADLLRRAIATAAHEIRGPVGVLMGVAETLTLHGDDLSQPQRERMLSVIGWQTRLLDNITADLLAAGQAQHGALAMQLEKVDAAELVRSVIDDEFDLALVDHRPAHVLTDPLRFQQMLSNLLSNARKYGQPPFLVRITSQGSHVSIDVEDNGPGVPQDFSPRLFQEYSRAPGNTARGTGLGLFVVRALAEAQGGTVTYTPRRPRGSGLHPAPACRSRLRRTPILENSRSVECHLHVGASWTPQIAQRTVRIS